MRREEALKVYRDFVIAVLICYDGAETNGDCIRLADICLDHVRELREAHYVMEFGHLTTRKD